MVVAAPNMSTSQDKSQGLGIIRSLWASLSRSEDYLPKERSFYGKVAIVTGAMNGPGFETCRQLLSHGIAKVIMATRFWKEGERNTEPLRKEFPAAIIEVWEIEMDSYESITEFAIRVYDDLERLDMVILNSGFAASEVDLEEYNKEREVRFQVNYLSTALLGTLLLGALREKSPKNELGRLTLVTKADFHFFRMIKKIFFKPNNEPEVKKQLLEYWVQNQLLGYHFVEQLASFIPSEQVLINAVCYRGPTKKTLSRGSLPYIDALLVKGIESHGKYIEKRHAAK
ncbi:retinol dehydrogenase 12 [Fusarium beomiforme]|uniref:Retinol dehydrogenase 12 n=1 Tax=Fusarium beomiforme TaxID=44412 RepID=A0A9P5E532_9HYPO|nr:retinol dehydrogenase 12 [Fusarium beomiforme]